MSSIAAMRSRPDGRRPGLRPARSAAPGEGGRPLPAPARLASGVGAAWARSNALRSLLLIGFGVLLGWSASSVLHFYDRLPVQDGPPGPGSAGSQGSPSVPAPGAIDGAGEEPAADEVQAQQASPLALLGGNEAPDTATFFCSVLVVNPAGCDLEAHLRAEPLRRAQPTPSPSVRPPPAIGPPAIRAGDRRRPTAGPPAGPAAIDDLFEAASRGAERPAMKVRPLGADVAN